MMMMMIHKLIYIVNLLSKILADIHYVKAFLFIHS